MDDDESNYFLPAGLEEDDSPKNINKSRSSKSISGLVESGIRRELTTTTTSNLYTPSSRALALDKGMGDPHSSSISTSSRGVVNPTTSMRTSHAPPPGLSFYAPSVPTSSSSDDLAAMTSVLPLSVLEEIGHEDSSSLRYSHHHPTITADAPYGGRELGLPSPRTEGYTLPLTNSAYRGPRPVGLMPPLAHNPTAGWDTTTQAASTSVGDYPYWKNMGSGSGTGGPPHGVGGLGVSRHGMHPIAASGIRDMDYHSGMSGTSAHHRGLGTASSSAFGYDAPLVAPTSIPGMASMEIDPSGQARMNSYGYFRPPLIPPIGYHSSNVPVTVGLDDSLAATSSVSMAAMAEASVSSTHLWAAKSTSDIISPPRNASSARICPNWPHCMLGARCDLYHPDEGIDSPPSEAMVEVTLTPVKSPLPASRDKTPALPSVPDALSSTISSAISPGRDAALGGPKQKKKGKKASSMPHIEAEGMSTASLASPTSQAATIDTPVSPAIEIRASSDGSSRSSKQGTKKNQSKKKISKEIVTATETTTVLLPAVPPAHAEFVEAESEDIHSSSSKVAVDDGSIHTIVPSVVEPMPTIALPAEGHVAPLSSAAKDVIGDVPLMKPPSDRDSEVVAVDSRGPPSLTSLDVGSAATAPEDAKDTLATSAVRRKSTPTESKQSKAKAAVESFKAKAALSGSPSSTSNATMPAISSTSAPPLVEDVVKASAAGKTKERTNRDDEDGPDDARKTDITNVKATFISPTPSPVTADKTTGHTASSRIGRVTSGATTSKGTAPTTASTTPSATSRFLNTAWKFYEDASTRLMFPELNVVELIGMTITKIVFIAMIGIAAIMIALLFVVFDVYRVHAFALKTIKADFEIPGIALVIGGLPKLARFLIPWIPEFLQISLLYGVIFLFIADGSTSNTTARLLLSQLFILVVLAWDILACDGLLLVNMNIGRLITTSFVLLSLKQCEKILSTLYIMSLTFQAVCVMVFGDQPVVQWIVAVIALVTLGTLSRHKEKDAADWAQDQETRGIEVDELLSEERANA